jgi:hypothetical protein
MVLQITCAGLWNARAFPILVTGSFYRVMQQTSDLRGPDDNKLKEISTGEPVLDRFLRKAKMLAWKIRQKF